MEKKRCAFHWWNSPTFACGEEYLYSAMEDYKIDIMLETGPNARSVQIGLNPLILVGATTRSGMLQNQCWQDSGFNLIRILHDRTFGNDYREKFRVLAFRFMKMQLWKLRDEAEEPRIANHCYAEFGILQKLKGNGRNWNWDYQIYT